MRPAVVKNAYYVKKILAKSGLPTKTRAVKRANKRATCDAQYDWRKGVSCPKFAQHQQH